MGLDPVSYNVHPLLVTTMFEAGLHPESCITSDAMELQEGLGAAGKFITWRGMGRAPPAARRGHPSLPLLQAELPLLLLYPLLDINER